MRGRFTEATRNVRDHMANTGECNRCSRWEIRTAEGTEGEQIKILNVGYWTPSGTHLNDVLFPHATCLMRGRVLNVASMEVMNRAI